MLREDISKALVAAFPSESFVQMANTVSYSGTTYSTGMILAYGLTGGLPGFVKLIQIIVVNGKDGFIVKRLNAWYSEHFRSFELENTKSDIETSDIFPTAAYIVSGKCMVTLKHYIHFL